MSFQARLGAGFSPMCTMRIGLLGFAVASLSTPAAAIGFVQTNLVSDIPLLAANTDPNLINPWGIASSATSPFWVSDNGTGVSTLYKGTGEPQSLVVTIPSGGAGPSAPTGVVFNESTGFELTPGNPARFIFATEGGTIAGWNPTVNATNAIIKVLSSENYKGLAISTSGAGNFLYAANFSSAHIDVFDSSFAPTTLAGSFTDPNLPAGFAPFNVQNLGGTLYVTYAKVGAGGDDEAGPGIGIVDAFDTNGNFIRRIVASGVLNSPWGVAIAPAAFGPFGGDLLVGNFGDGRINAFDPTTGLLEGTLSEPDGDPITIEGLWGLKFGNDGNGGDSDKLYFAAGISGDGEIEDHGLFGSLAAVGDEVPGAAPEPATLAVFGMGLLGLGIARRKTVRT